MSQLKETYDSLHFAYNDVLKPDATNWNIIDSTRPLADEPEGLAKCFSGCKHTTKSNIHRYDELHRINEESLLSQAPNVYHHGKFEKLQSTETDMDANTVTSIKYSEYFKSLDFKIDIQSCKPVTIKYDTIYPLEHFGKVVKCEKLRGF